MKNKKKVDTNQSLETSLTQSISGNLFSDSFLNALKPSEVPNSKEGNSQNTEVIEYKGVVRLRRLKAGKGGKTVTEVSLPEDFRESWQKEILYILKQKLSCGGAFKGGGVLEFQGDHRELIQDFFKSKGMRVLLAGG